MPGIWQARAADVQAVAHQVAVQVAEFQAEPAQIVEVVELCLRQIPASVRQSLKRREDPTGTTVPPTFALQSPADMVKLMPPGLPRFRPGDALPGRARTMR